MELNEIKNLITEKRKLKGLSQADVVKVLGISQPAYSKYESGPSPIPLKTLKLLDLLLDLNLDYLTDSNNSQTFQQDLLSVLDKIAISLEAIANNTLK